MNKYNIIAPDIHQSTNIMFTRGYTIIYPIKSH